MSVILRSVAFRIVAVLALAGFGACAPRMMIVTGTSIGLHATPGDGQTQPPQVSLGYKRAESALVPTAGNLASDDPADPRDALSSFVSFGFSTAWFGETRVDSLISTGVAARKLAGSSEAAAAFDE